VACKKTYLASLDASWANYPYGTGYSPERWRNGVDILIPKKVFDMKVESLRPILLFEVDCNQNNKLLGRTVMQMAETHHGLADKQYGSRKHHSAAEQALNKQLTFDILLRLGT
jgi:hypothetical protein